MGLETLALPTLISSGAVLAGGAVGAYGALHKGAAEKAAADYNAAIASRNAGIATAQARADMADKERENRRYLGGLRASFGASGLAFEGSMLDIFEDQAAETELSIARIKYGGELRAMGLMEQAALKTMEGKTAQTAGYVNAVSQVLGSVGSAFRLKRGASYAQD